MSGDERRFFVLYSQDGSQAEADVVVDQRYRVASVMVVRGREADLALCLAATVEGGVLDVEKLRAALVLAEPVAREKVAKIRSGKAER